MTRTLDEAAREAEACARCRLAEGRTTVVYGAGAADADVMFVGEGPGFHEDQRGVPFVGAAGQLLDRMLAAIGLSRDDVYIANVVKCRPPGNRDPLPDEIEACAPWLREQFELIAPRVVVTLGNFATRTVLGRQVSISRVRGQRFTAAGRTVVPTYHPAAILRGGGDASPRFAEFALDFTTIAEVVSGARGAQGERRAETPHPDAAQMELF